jgi:hypothetical protein
MFHRDSASVDPLVRQGSATRAGQQLSPCFNLIPVRMFSERRNGGGEALALMLALSIRRLAPMRRCIWRGGRDIAAPAVRRIQTRQYYSGLASRLKLDTCLLSGLLPLANRGSARGRLRAGRFSSCCALDTASTWRD